jgi:hypothetical protein
MRLSFPSNLKYINSPNSRDFYQKIELNFAILLNVFQLLILYGKMVFAKLKNFFAKLIFFPPNFFCLKRFLFSKIPKKVLAEKNQLSKKVF